MGGDWVAAHTALPSGIWATSLGLMLASYVPFLVFVALRPVTWLVRTIIALDWGYVCIATAYLITHWQQADATGLGLISLSTSLVALFAWLQMLGLAATRRDARA